MDASACAGLCRLSPLPHLRRRLRVDMRTGESTPQQAGSVSRRPSLLVTTALAVLIAFMMIVLAVNLAITVFAVYWQ